MPRRGASGWRNRPAFELTHNHGTEDDPGLPTTTVTASRAAASATSASPCPMVAALRAVRKLGVPFQKRLSDGRMKSLAFIKDPDGYWVEIIQPAPLD